MFVLNATARWTTGAALRAVWIATVRAAKLNHEAADNAVEMKSVIEVAVGEIDEILCRDWHLVEIDLGFEGSQRRVESSNGVGHSKSFVQVVPNAAKELL